MVNVKPDFYDSFSCISGQCRHSCCLGWEIDIDPESLRRFMATGGSIGEDIRRSIAAQPQPHFILDKDERCPFLRSDGLCRMILELGEDSLCNICREHPRFYNELPGRLEAGLGLCCEEVCRLLLHGSEHLGFSLSGVEEGRPDALIALRDEIYTFLRRDDISLTERAEQALALFGMEPAAFDNAETAEAFLGLERMEDGWTERLEALKASAGQELEPALSSLRYARLLEYLIYRHFAVAPDEYEAGLRLQLCFLCTRLICALDGIFKDDESARLFSAEVEYSDENLELLLDYMDEKIN